MTEALTNYDILNNAQISADTIPAVTPIVKTAMDDTSDFTDILDKQILNTQLKTLGDIKNTVQLSDVSDKMADFKEFLAEATSEANVESSLDLTLARDINDIISQLKGAIDEQSQDIEEKEEVTAGTEIIRSEECEVSTDTKENDIKKTVPLVFEQVLTLADKAVEVDNTGLAKDLLNKATDLAETVLENKFILEDTEELALETDLEQTDEVSQNSELNVDEDVVKELNIESVKADTDTTDNNSFMNRQSPEEHSAKVVIGHQIEKFEMPVNTTQTTQAQAQTNTNDINPSRIIEQITKQLENMNGSKVNIVLNPQALGKINLQISNTQEGLSAQFTVSSNEVRDLLMKGLDGLKEALGTHGVGVDNITIRLNETEEASYNPDWTDQEGSRGGNKGQGQQRHQEKEKGLFEKTIANQFKKNGNV